MADIYVSSSDELEAAVRTADRGDSIKLAGGTYDSILLKNIQTRGEIVIESADANDPAILTELDVRDSKGLTFRNLELFVDPANGIYPFTIANSSNIVLDRLNVHGTLNDDVTDDTSPLLIRGSTNVTVSNSEFQQVWHGIAVMDSERVALTDNAFHDVRTDGIRAGGVSNLTVTGNSFTDFYNDGKDHPDAIQIWSTNAKASAHDIVIADNIITRGEGTAYQGIFIRDTFDKLPFADVTIRGNTIVGALFNGISVDGVNGLKIDKNIVAGQEDQASWLRVQNAAEVSVTNNLATAYTYIDTPAVTRSGNILVAAMSDDLVDSVNDWIAQNDFLAGGVAGISGLFTSFLTAALSKIGYVDGGTSTITTDPLSFDEVQIVGTSGNDRLTVAGVGNSRILAGDGDDTLIGGRKGDHVLIGGLGDDNYSVHGAGDTVVEGAGEGSDAVNAYIRYTLPDNVETLRMMTGGLTGHGNALDNRIVGSNGQDRLYGEAGNDLIQAGNGHDLVWGGTGADDLRGGDGNDQLYGESGMDMLSGGDGNDKLWGGADADTLKGEDGNDVLTGEAGNDLLFGGAGGDTLLGGAGSDWLEGGAGSDRLTGGSGADTFVFRASDFDGPISRTTDDIVDFSSAQRDKISLSAVDADTDTRARDAFTFIGKAGFHHEAGELRYVVSGGDSYVYGDTDGDGRADFAIHLIGVTSLTAADFLL